MTSEGSGITIGNVPSDPACGITFSGSSKEAEFQFPAIVEVDIWNFHFCWRIPLSELQPIKFDVSSDELIFLEVFAGSANLSGGCKAQRSFGACYRPQNETSIESFNPRSCLTRTNDVDVLLDMATYANIGSAHFAPRCGTSSKARERPLPKGMEMIPAEPLRSPSCLLGVLGLKDLDAKRVAAANKLYALTLCLVCILFVVELFGL